MRLIAAPLAVALVALHTLASPGVLARQTVRPVPPAAYRIVASLDPINRLLVGTARITWRNTSTQPVSDVRLLTPWNSRRHDRTTWARERRIGGFGPDSVADGARGFIDLSAVSAVTPSGPRDLLGTSKAVAPDGGTAGDATVWSVPMDPAIGPGQSVELDVRWTARVPELADGLGARGSFFLIAQWFPRIGLLQDDGWHAHETHLRLPATGAYGRFDVDLRIPSGWAVGATGRETAMQDHGDGFTTHRFVAEAVSDFAWATSPVLVERTDRFAELGSPPVDIRVLLLPEHAWLGDRHLAAAKTALSAYGRWFGAYPWGLLTIVDTPEVTSGPPELTAGLVASHAGLLATHTPWIAPWTGTAPERAIVAGVGEQHWSALAGPDVTEHTWMGSGLAAYVTDRVMKEHFGGRFVRVERYFGGLIAWPYADAKQDLGADARAAMRQPSPVDPADTPGWQQHPAALAAIVSSRTPLTFRSLEGLLGWDVVGAALATHLARGTGRHPTPDEFLAITNSAANRDLSWFFGATHRSSARFDYAVESVTSTPTGTDALDSTIVLRRHGDGVFPVEVRVVFGDESSVVERWDGAASWHALRYRRGAAVTTVEVDPDRTLALDAERTNNSWSSQPRGSEASEKWARRWAAWFQHLLLTYAFLV